MTKDFLLKTEKFNLYIDFFDHLNVTALYELYLPIVEPQAIMLYEYLYNLKKITNHAHITRNNIYQLTQVLNLTLDNLTQYCCSLEAVGLLKTYINREQPDYLTFVLVQPLDYEQFMCCTKLVETLKQKLSAKQFHELRYIFNQQLVDSNWINISESIDYFTNQSLDESIQPTIDFNVLTQDILVKYNKKVIFDNVSKNEIIKVYTNNKMTLQELVVMINNALVCTTDNFCVVNSAKFSLDSAIDNKDLVPHKINRSYKIFNLHEQLENYPSVINDYQTINPENYILQLTHQDISLDMKKTLSNLKYKFSLKDECINVLIDYCLLKNFGRLEPNYIYKIANTIHSANLTTLSSVIKYLQYIHNNIKPNVASIFQDNLDHNISNHDDIWS